MMFIIRGTSCSGKDTFIGTQFKEHTVLSSDKIRLMFCDEIANQNLNNFVFKHLREVLEIRLQNRVSYTVINATNLKFKDIAEYLTLAEKYSSNVTVISIDPPGTDVLIQRNKKRGESGGLEVPEEVLHRHLNSYFAGMNRFKEVAEQNDHISFVRIDQNYDLVEAI